MALTHTTSVGGECSHDHATLTPFPSPRKFEVVIVLYCFDCERSWKEKKEKAKKREGSLESDVFNTEFTVSSKI